MKKKKLQHKTFFRKLFKECKYPSQRSLEYYYIDINGDWGHFQTNVFSEYENENFLMTFKPNIDFFIHKFELYHLLNPMEKPNTNKLITEIIEYIDFLLED